MAFSEWIWAHDNKHWLNEIVARVKGLAGTSVSLKIGTTTVTGTVGSDGTTLVALPKLGTYTVSAEISGKTVSNTTNIDRYGITDVWAMGQIAFADATAAQIKAVCDSGKAGDFWNVGDRHVVTMQDGTTLAFKIADFNHDVDPSGNKLAMSLIAADCLSVAKQFNTGNTNAGGWKSSYMRQTIIPSVLANFPQEWQNIIATTLKKTSAGSQSSGIVQTEDKLWLPSEIEVFGARSYSFDGEGVQYPLFPDAASRVRTVAGTAQYWWERSPYNANATSFCTVSPAGAVYSGRYASNSYGVTLGFCI